MSRTSWRWSALPRRATPWSETTTAVPATTAPTIVTIATAAVMAVIVIAAVIATSLVSQMESGAIAVSVGIETEAGLDLARARMLTPMKIVLGTLAGAAPVTVIVEAVVTEVTARVATTTAEADVADARALLVVIVAMTATVIALVTAHAVIERVMSVVAVADAAPPPPKLQRTIGTSALSSCSRSPSVQRPATFAPSLRTLAKLWRRRSSRIE